MNKLRSIFKVVGAWLGRHFPQQWVSFRYFIRFHKKLCWKNPQNLDEKILYLSLKTDTTMWTDLADKYKVREYVERCGYGDSLVKLYGKWDNAFDIDFDQLPSSFVLKTNHGSGEIKLIKDKSSIDKEALIAYFNKEISKPYGEIEGGRHYYRIKPCIIAEEMLVNDEISKQYSDSIIDYKVWCFNGRVHYIWVCCNRDKTGAEVSLYDRNWNPCFEYSIYTSHYRKGKTISSPKNLPKMIEIAEILSRPFPCVRVDLYNIGGKIYFGEMTFTSLGGLMNYFTDDFLEKAGGLIDLNYKG